MKNTVEEIAVQFGITKKLAKEVVDSVVLSIAKTIVADGSIKVTGLGTFKVKTRKERNGRNPKNGQKLVIPEHNVLTFKSSKSLSNTIQ